MNLANIWAAVKGNYLPLALGYGLNHIPLLIQELVRVLRPWILKYPGAAEAIVNSLKQDVDAVEAVPPAPANPPA